MISNMILRGDYLVGEILGKSWENLVEILGKSWRGVGEIFGGLWEILGEPWGNPQWIITSSGACLGQHLGHMVNNGYWIAIRGATCKMPFLVTSSTVGGGGIVYFGS